jgi:hypothetical protein
VLRNIEIATCSVATFINEIETIVVLSRRQGVVRGAGIGLQNRTMVCKSGGRRTTKKKKSMVGTGQYSTRTF